jgi:pimeloyl-ACP methyl ester carboxylesterase
VFSLRANRRTFMGHRIIFTLIVMSVAGLSTACNDPASSEETALRRGEVVSGQGTVVHGESDHAASYEAEDFSSAVLAVMDDAGVERGVLVGHSFGVSVARDVALEWPTRVAGLYMLDGFLVPLAGGDPALVDPLLAAFQSDARQQSAAAFIEQYMIGERLVLPAETFPRPDSGARRSGRRVLTRHPRGLGGAALGD